MHRSHRSYGFTLIELLVVIAIIAILAAILFPVFAQVREKARQTTCASNEKQIALAILQYVQDFDETMPPNEYGTSNSSSQLYWPFLVDPYVKSGVQSSATGPAKSQLKSVFFCPDYLASTPDGQSVIRNEAKTRGLFSYNVNDYICPDLEVGKTFQAPATLGTIDAPASLVMVAESLGDLSYVQGRDDAAGGYNDLTTSGTNFHDACYMNARRRHSNGSNYAFTDGHVKWFPAPGDTLGAQYNGGGYTGQDRSTTIAWAKCDTGRFSNPVGYFFPPRGVVQAANPGASKFQGSSFPSDTCQ